MRAKTISDLTPSYVVGEVLYCSEKCAEAHKGLRAAAWGHALAVGEFSTERFGALCPMCGREYNEF